ncbi:Fbox domain containing protein [Acanthamoeba castellanii str. Neff]|uniref:Fbox domain containing protein n=1 Tax=Acanthamoeba castellanii (strain ATCC 30010 / Neff) TaxID=1257118 RepID=L8GRU8_ACACF|nr:Fbox domain containing protein [Acanthamoeba castellanii str. Neff]ELR15358.1 Fbox domain containing protein [Acanthamoeba castellanii str. Neff]
MAAVPATQLLSPRCGGTVDFITALPPELSLHVLLFVPLSAVGCTLSLVSRAWKRCTANRSQMTTPCGGQRWQLQL